jgi:hypothetical protein
VCPLRWLTFDGCLTVAFIAQVPMGPAHEVLDVFPLMMNRQDVFISGASWARVKSRFPLLPFDHFWWAKLGLYDKKNQDALRFWQNTDLAERQSERMLFGLGLVLGVGEDINNQDAIDYLYGQENLSLDDKGKLRVLKPKPLELEERDLQ